MVGLPVLAVDKDDVLVDFAVPFLRWYKKQVGKTIGLKRIKESFQDMGISAEYIAKFIDEGNMATLEPIPGAKRALQKLYDKYEIVVVSATRENGHSSSLLNLDKLFGDLITRVYFTDKKSELLGDLGAVVFIDDRPKYISSALEVKGCKVICFAQPWNLGVKAWGRGRWPKILSMLG